MKILMIDPPSGWRYGFPMGYTPNEGETMEEFIVRHGYPKEDAAWACQNMRIWYEPEEQ